MNVYDVISCMKNNYDIYFYKYELKKVVSDKIKSIRTGNDGFYAILSNYLYEVFLDSIFVKEDEAWIYFYEKEIKDKLRLIKENPEDLGEKHIEVELKEIDIYRNKIFKLKYDRLV